MQNSKKRQSQQNPAKDIGERQITDAEIAARSLEGTQPFRDEDAKVRAAKEAKHRPQSEREEKVNTEWDEDEIEAKEPSEKPPRPYHARSVSE